MAAVSTNSVDITITNILEGHLKYTPISTPAGGGPSKVKTTPASQVFRKKGNSPSVQRHLSLEERKREMLNNARR